MHPRSGLCSGPSPPSLLSAQSGLSHSPRHRAGHPQLTPTRLSPLVAGNAMEKRVCRDEDGGLSVEVKVRFCLPGEDAHLWAGQGGWASTLTGASSEAPAPSKAGPLHWVREGHPEGPPGCGAGGLLPCETGCSQEACGGGRWQPECEVWRNPLHAPWGAGPAVQRSPGPAQHSLSRGPRGPRAAGRRGSSEDSTSLTSGHQACEGSAATPPPLLQGPPGRRCPHLWPLGLLPERTQAGSWGHAPGRWGPT
ncbi:Retinitis pigmentosa 1-like 1 protein [Galemys pyrenaicus]|uniref:Retinitis pigmentosa 1-like 1 protein n=1 Tax=Galemys pyrenaicus TaxID=202257 RepID=A0A8J6DG14_GALPY|nr:Retinitis pigmentosa 1-like 1 protein [Galemys pyrenaicus]